MILTSLLFLTNLGLVGLSMKRLRLHIRFNRASRDGDFEEALKILQQLRRLPTTPWGKEVCDALLLRTASVVRDWELVEETWQRLQERSLSNKRVKQEATAYYAASLIERGFYREGISYYEQALTQPTEGRRTLLTLIYTLAMASSYIRLGEFGMARSLLDGCPEALNRRPLRVFVVLITSNLDFLEGNREKAGDALVKVSTDPQSLSQIPDPILVYPLVRSLCRCGLPEPARALFPSQPGKVNAPKNREQRLIAAASLADAEGNTGKALSYYRDLKALQAIDAEAYVRASTLCRKEGRQDEAIDFLHAAMDLDPQSHWAHIARRKLDKLHG